MTDNPQDAQPDQQQADTARGEAEALTDRRHPLLPRHRGDASPHPRRLPRATATARDAAGRARAIGQAALSRVLAEHTYAHRAKQVEAVLDAGGRNDNWVVTTPFALVLMVGPLRVGSIGLDIGSNAVKAIELKPAGKGFRVSAIGVGINTFGLMCSRRKYNNSSLNS